MAIRTDLSRLSIPSESLRAFQRGGLIRVAVPAIWRVAVGDTFECKAGNALGYASVASIEGGCVGITGPDMSLQRTIPGMICLMKGYY